MNTMIIKAFIYQKLVIPICRPFVRASRKKKKFQTSLFNFFIQTIDTTKIPKARGPLRVYQKANAIFFKQLIEIFEKHNISYWLMAGTLLGCVRHKGFIPWDSDIDISMIREDYERLPEILEEEFKTMPNFYFRKCDILKIFYKNLPLSLDIEPYDIYPQYLDDNGRKKLKKILKNYHSKLLFEAKEETFSGCTYIINKTPKELNKMREEILNIKSPSDKKMIIASFEISPQYFANGHMIFDYNWIFPLKKAEFEGIMCNIPNRPDLNLFENYGKNYMYLPQNIDLSAYNSRFRNITTMTMAKLTDYVETNLHILGNN